MTLQQAVKQAIEEAAPEIVHIDVVDDDTSAADGRSTRSPSTEKPVRRA